MKARLLLLITLIIAGTGVRALAAESFMSRTPNGVRIECVYDPSTEYYYVIFSKWKSLFVVPFQIECPGGS
jgi:hypothetical protein